MSTVNGRWLVNGYQFNCQAINNPVESRDKTVYCYMVGSWFTVLILMYVSESIIFDEVYEFYRVTDRHV